jgi:hypothetical protein
MQNAKPRLPTRATARRAEDDGIRLMLLILLVLAIVVVLTV